MRNLTRLLVGMLLGAVLVAPAASVAAQATPDGTGDNPFADLGLPQLDVTMTNDAFEGVPSELEAGRYVVALTNETGGPEGETAGAAFLQIPEEMTTAEFLDLAGPAPATPEAEETMASPVAEEEGDGGPPPWYYETAITGGPYAFPGETAYTVLDLMAGEWVFWAEYPGAPQAPIPVTVTGEPPVDQPTPSADVTIEMSEFAFAFNGSLTAGPQIIELVNVGQQPHFLALAQVPAGTTVDDVLALIESFDPAATPAATPAAALTLEDVIPVLDTGDQSAGVTAWYAADVPAGTLVAACFVTDPDTGLPHAMLGMLEIIEIS